MKIFAIVFALLLLFLVSCNKQSGQTQVHTADLQIVTRELPNWQSGGTATYRVEVSGGVPPYGFKIEGSLPQGFNLGPAGTIGGGGTLPSGTSKQTFPPFILVVTDSKGTTVKASFAISIIESNTLQLITQQVTCSVKKKCDEVIATAANGNPPYSFQSDSFREGAPPMGTIIDINGHLTGTPSKEGEYTVGVCVKDTIGNSKCEKARVTVEKEEVSILDGVWEGSYSETSGSKYCKFKESGSKTFRITTSGDSFTGTADYSGTSTPIGGEHCQGGAYSNKGTLSGTISGSQVSGTIVYSSTNVPFTATLEDNTLSGKYSYTESDYEAPTSGSGEFSLKKKS